MLDENPLALVVGSEETRGALYFLLEGHGYRIATCGSGLEALKVVARCKPDLVFSDARLHDITGRELSREVKRISPSSRVVVMSSGVPSESRIAGLSRAVDRSKASGSP